uniref:Uncharacterized protein n=1 Tax=Mycena chlorophos TaxID=658473 RepID=A0ABQ0KWV2_MYCCL|nr:predicted protein [Mycena chlorophos]
MYFGRPCAILYTAVCAVALTLKSPSPYIEPDDDCHPTISAREIDCPRPQMIEVGHALAPVPQLGLVRKHIDSAGESDPDLAPLENEDSSSDDDDATACTISCSTGSPTTAPAQSDCDVVRDYLLYLSGGNPNTNTTIPAVPQGYSGYYEVFAYQSCTAYLGNTDNTNALNFSLVALAMDIQRLTASCGPAQNAHGGICYGPGGSWFVETKHS